MNLAEGQRPAEQRTQLEVDEDPPDGEKRFAIGLVKLQAVDLQAQDEWVHGDFLQSQLDTQVVPDRVRGRVLYQPWGKEEPEERVDDYRGPNNNQRLLVALGNHSRRAT